MRKFLLSLHRLLVVGLLIASVITLAALRHLWLATITLRRQITALLDRAQR